MVPLYASALPCQTSVRLRPSTPRTRSPIGMSVTWKPVPKMIASTSRSVPSALTIERSRNSRMPSVTSSTLGLVKVGYHSLLGRMRLQPMANDGVSLRRSSGSFTWVRRCLSATRSTMRPRRRWRNISRYDSRPQ